MPKRNAEVALSSRRAYTMIEILVVIAVIALMMALLIGASFRFVVGARESATLATIMRASGIIDDRVRSFRETDFDDAAIIASVNWNSKFPNDPVMSQKLSEILIRKTRFRKAFPQAFAELDQSQIARFFPVGTTIPPVSYDAKYEAGIVLYALLMHGETFGAPTPTADTFTGSEIKKSPVTGNLPCLVDAWGEPLRFYRWPTRLIRCGEQDLDGNGLFDDYNQNGVKDGPGWVDVNASVSPQQARFSPAIRPYSSFPGPTPVSLLIPNLSLFDRTGPYAKGPDRLPGVAGEDDDGLNGIDDPGEIGWPITDDPEFLNTDPDDPQFALVSWFGDQAVSAQTQVGRRIQFVLGSAQYNFSDYSHDFYSFHSPLIVSSGQDKQLGLWEPTDVPSTNMLSGMYLGNYGYLAAPKLSSAPLPALKNLFDDISNFNRRSGGK